MGRPSYGCSLRSSFWRSRQDLFRDPILKRLGLRLVAPHDELVEATLGDQLEVRGRGALEQRESDSLRSRDDSALLRVQSGGYVAQPGGDAEEDAVDVSGDEPRLPLKGHYADTVGDYLVGFAIGLAYSNPPARAKSDLGQG